MWQSSNRPLESEAPPPGECTSWLSRLSRCRLTLSHHLCAGPASWAHREEPAGSRQSPEEAAHGQEGGIRPRPEEGSGFRKGLLQGRKELQRRRGRSQASSLAGRGVGSAARSQSAAAGVVITCFAGEAPGVRRVAGGSRAADSGHLAGAAWGASGSGVSHGQSRDSDDALGLWAKGPRLTLLM